MAQGLVIGVHIEVVEQQLLGFMPQYHHTDSLPKHHQVVGALWREVLQKTGSGTLGIKAAHTLQAGAHGRDAQGDKFLGIAGLGGFKMKCHGWP